MDMTEAITPNSQQLDAIDLIGGEREFLIERVEAGAPTDTRPRIFLADFPRPWRPGKNMSRVLVAAWGKKGADYVGQRVVLKRDPEVVYGKEKVGGVRIVAMSGLTGPLEAVTLESQGRPGKYLVNPLPNSPAPAASPEPTLAEINATTDVADLRAMWSRATTDKTKALITARKDELTATADTARAAVQDALAGTEAE